MQVSQPGIGEVCTIGICLAAASVLDNPPGLVKSTSQASISIATLSVNPKAMTLECPPKFFISFVRNSVLFPHTIITSTLSPNCLRISLTVSCRCPNPILPDIIRNHFF